MLILHVYKHATKSWPILYRGIDTFREWSFDWLAAPGTYFNLAFVFEHLYFGLWQFEDLATITTTDRYTFQMVDSARA